jgi:iron complex outermembrane receptor protein
MTYETKLSRSLRLIFSGSAAVGFAMLAQPVFAQVAPTPDTSSAEPVQTVVVTGSMIKRVDAETAEAVTVIKAETLKDMGITSVEGALALVTSNNSTFNTASNVGAYGGGTSTASLRSLGANKTLILLDGQRLANNVTLGSATDLNTIPFAAIESIEVLQEGASSLYGSDAIGGVINFITKKNLEGGTLNVSGTKPSGSGGSSTNAEFSWGKGNLDEDGYNLMITASYTRQNELTASERSFASTGYNPSMNLANFNGPYGPAPGSYTDGNGTLYQVGYPGCAGYKNVLPINGSCQFEYSAAVDLIPRDTSENALVAFTKKLSGDNTLSVQYFISHFDLTTWGGPQEYFFNVDPSSPYYPTAANSSQVPGQGPAAAPALGAPVLAGWTDPANNRYNGNSNTEQRLLLTFAGSNGGWDYTTSLNLSQNKGVQKVEGGYANYAVIAPGNTVSNLINPFGPQSAAGNALLNSAYMNGDLEIGKLNMYDLSGQASHSLGDAFNAGRPAQLALGFDMKDETISNNPTPLATTLYTATYFPPFTISGTRQSKAIYEELNIPVTKKFDFTISDRFDQFSDFGETNNAKLSFVYQPFEALKFRGAASTGFRAPSLTELYSPQTFGATAGNMNGPGCASGNYNAVFTQLNCISQGLALSGGNPDLKPETSKNFDLGIIVEPVRDLDITADYYRIIVTNEIQAIPSETIYGNPTQFASLYNLNNSGTLSPASAANVQCPTPQAATCGYITQTSQNTGGISTDGIDLSASYSLKTSGYGKFRFGMTGDYVMDYYLQTYTGGPQLNLVGRFNQGFQPVIRYQQVLTLDWTMDKFGAGLNNHYMSKYQDQYADAAGNAVNVGAYSIWNIYGTYKPMKGLKLLAGINNLFNTNPPFSNQNENWQAGYNSVFTSPIGRALNVGLTYEF